MAGSVMGARTFRGAFWRRTTTGVGALSLALTLLVPTSGTAWAKPGGASNPKERSTSVSPVNVRSAAVSDQSLAQAPVRHVTWPTPGAAVATGANSGSAGFVRAGTLPVWVGSSSSLKVTDKAAALSAAQAVSPAQVRVNMLDHNIATALGVDGVVFTVARADGLASDGSAAVKVDYSGFAGAAGGDFGGRLRLVRLPACALTTPSVSGCLDWTELPTANDVNAQTVTAQVPLAATATAPGALSSRATATDSAGVAGAAAPDVALATVVAVAAVGSADTGTFAKTSFSDSFHWQAGTSGGGFSWSYPMRVPPAPGGLAPQVALGYSSSAVDGRTNSTNYQGSWVGEGWDYQPGYIERVYRSCTDDTTDVPAPHWTNATGDECWRDDNATIVWNGHSTDIVRSGSTWRLADDDATKVEKLTGGANYDNDGEYWRLTTTDGTRYYFGKNRLPGWASGKRETQSVFNVATFANKSTEPCYSATSFAASHCNQAWRWNLDYVVDNHGNTLTYYYTKDQAKTGLAGSSTSTIVYDRGGWLDHIEYGTTYGHELDNTTPPMKVVFGVSDRCTTSSCGTHDSTNWPDTPWDLNCATTATSCPSNVSPTFWITKRLSSVTTQYWNGAAYQDVDRWDLGASWQDVGYLLLSSITHTGKVGGSTALPAITFGYTLLANRTDATATNGISVANHARVTSITTESGGRILVTYEASDCTPTNVPSASPSTNSMRCFPQYWKPPTQPAGWGWWNKWRVSQVVERDLVGGQPDVVHSYAYSTAGSSTTVLWHHSAGAAAWSTPGSKRSWADFRGWPTVTVTTGASGQTQSKTTSLYFRGMNGDDTATTEAGRSATITDTWGDAAYPDDGWLAGRVLQQTTFDGASGHELFSTVTDPWTHLTGTRTEDPDHLYPSHQYSYLTGDARVRTRTWIPSTSTYRTTETDNTHENTYGLVTATTDKGDTSLTSDDVCTTTTYAQSTSTATVDGATSYLINFPAQQFTTDCTASPAPANYLAGAQTLYDNTTTVGAAPTRGLVTKATTLASFTGTTPVWAQTARTTYDSLGRALDSYDALDHKTTAAYTPATGGPVTGVSLTNPAGFVTTTTIDPAWGTPKTVTDPNLKVTTGQYDPLGRLAKVWLPGRSTSLTGNTEYTYSMGGTGAPSYIATKALGPTGVQVTSYEIFDGLLRARQAQTAAPDANGGRMIADTQYDSRGLAVKNSSVWNSAAGPSATLVAVADASVAKQERSVYDGAGRKTADQVWSLNSMKWQTTTSFDGVSSTTTPPDGGTASTAFINARGKTSTLREYLGSTPTGSYQDTTFGYDRLDRLTAQTDASGSTWTTTYDLRGRRTGSTDPDRGSVTSTYDDAGKLTSTADARGVTLSYAYDSLGRKTSEWQGAVTTGTKLVDYTYDSVLKGQLTSQTRYDGADAYTTTVTGYDDGYRALGTTVTLPASTGLTTLSYTSGATYNVNGSIATESLPAAGGLPAETLTSTYDTSGHPLTLAGADTYISGSSYYAYGALFQRLLGTGSSRVRLTTSVDEATGRLTTNGVETEHPGTPNSWDEQRTDQYTYTPGGTLTSLAETKAGSVLTNQCFGYDGLTRLTAAWTTTASACQTAPTTADVGGTAPFWTTWAYDAVGDRKTQTQHGLGGVADTVTSYTYPAATAAQPHAVTSTSTTGPGGTTSAAYQYDNTGNTHQRPAAGGTQTLNYDAEGHLSTVVQGGQTTKYVYQPDGTRLLQQAPDGTITVYLGSQQITRTPAGGLSGQRDYAGVATRTNAGLTWLASDHNGTAQFAINPTSLAVTIRRTLPFGETRGAAPTWPNDKGFVGGTVDPTGLVHLGAREYDSTLGRFVSVDPVQNAADPQSWNGYAYADNNPVTHSDPSGLMLAADGGGGGADPCTGMCATYRDYYTANYKKCGMASCPDPKPTPTPTPTPGPTGGKPNNPNPHPTPHVMTSGEEEYAHAYIEFCGREPEICQAMADAAIQNDLWNAAILLTAIASGVVDVASLFLAPELEPEEGIVELRILAAEEEASEDTALAAVVSKLTPYQKGELGKFWSTEAAIGRGEEIVGNEVDLTFTINGKPVSIRADVLSKDANGQYVYIESKYSPRAPYTPNQEQVIPALVRSGDEGLTATVGPRSGSLAPGTQINVVFQGDVWDSGPTLYGN